MVVGGTKVTGEALSGRELVDTPRLREGKGERAGQVVIAPEQVLIP